MQSIYNYSDPVSYIRDYLQYRENVEDNFSFKRWASELGFTSPAPLVELLKGKKTLRPDWASNIIHKIGLDPSEHTYFMTLVAKTRASHPREESVYDLFLNDLRPSADKEYEMKRFEDGEIFSHWILTTIISMTELKNFEISAENIKNCLREDLPLELIQSALVYLIEKGLLEKKDGELVRRYDTVSSTNDKKHLNVKNYYVQMADLSKKAIDLPVEEREFQSFSIALSNEDMPMAKEMIRKCRSNLSKLGEASQGEKNIYQMNMFFFPLTK